MEIWRHLLNLSQQCQSMLQLKRIHACLLRHNIIFTPLILSKLFLFAAISPHGNLHYATLLFSHNQSFTLSHSPFFYNTLIRGYANKSSPTLAFSIFISMRRRSIPPDNFTFTFLMKAQARSSSTSSYNCETCIHAQVLKFGCLGSQETHLYVHNALINLYASVALLDAVLKVFDEMPLQPDAVSWSGLLNAYLRAGETDAARAVFDYIIPAEQRDVVSWTAMISGYTRAGRPRDALKLFDKMPMPPDEVTMVGLISSCAATGDLDTGEDLHRYVEANGLGWMVSLCNALIDMYAKCGCLLRARKVFDEMNEQKRSLVTWNSMIWAYAAHGEAEQAITLFRKLSSREVNLVMPDRVTNLAVLSACAHAGRVEEGRKLFAEMTKSREEVGVEHYGCIVDMLGRAGMLVEALHLVEEMPFESNDKVWGALLGGCRIHGDLKMGERAVAKLMKLKPEEGGYYILLSAIYVEAGRSVDAAMIRRSMDWRKATKTPGFSHNGS